MPATIIDSWPDDSELFTGRPTFRVSGAKVASLTSALSAMLVAEDVDGPHHCEATFSNQAPAGGFAYFRRVLDFGKSFEVLSGTDVIFAGRIIALGGDFAAGAPPTVMVRAEDRLMDLRMTRRTRTFADTSVADVVQRIAGDHGLEWRVDVPGQSEKLFAQLNESDLAFLKRLCRDAGAELWVDGATLHAARRAARDTGRVALTYGRELREVSIAADLSEQRTSVLVSGWSVADKQAISHEARGPVISPEVHWHQSGSAILQSEIGERKESVAGTASMSAEAQARAESCFAARARRFVVARGVARFSAQLRVGNTAELRGVGSLFEGDYYLSATRHRFDTDGGLRTEFVAERAWLGDAS